MAEEKIKLPRSSYEELAKIIKTYGHMKEPVNLDVVSSTLGMNKATISANAGFLTQIEILEPGQRKQLSPKGRELAKALDFEMPDEIRRAWRHIVHESAFLSRVLAAVRIRKGMDESSLASHIAYSAGEPKKPYVLTGARAVTDILRAAELIHEANGQFTVSPTSIEPVESKTVEVIDDEDSEATSRQLVGIVRSAQAPSSVGVNIEINIQCTPGNIGDLGKKIRQLLVDIEGQADVRSESDA